MDMKSKALIFILLMFCIKGTSVNESQFKWKWIKLLSSQKNNVTMIRDPITDFQARGRFVSRTSFSPPDHILEEMGLYVPQPKNLVVHILDGEVIVFWESPEGTPPNSQYNVQMAKYTEEWATVAGCTGITETFCDLSSFIHDYHATYKVRVNRVVGDQPSAWAAKKFQLSASELQPPSFTMWATSSTLTVYVHQKPVLKKIFPYGLIYTIYLEERGDDIKNTTAYLKDDTEENKRTKVFTSLHWGIEYCVSIKVEGIGALSESSVSPKHCLLLPEKEWFIPAVSSLSFLGMLVIIAITAAILLCYLRRPAKTPAALKSPVSGWLPLSVGEGAMEVVTDKGWFLSSNRTEVKNCVNIPVTHITVIEDNEEEDRSTRMDSRINMESSSTTNNGGSSPMRQEDSGCGSMGGPESSTSRQIDYPLEDERTDAHIVRKREDSGLGMGCQLDSSMNLSGQNSEPLKESVAGGCYRNQCPSAVQIHVCDHDMLKQILPDSDLAEVVTGYRAGPQSCICSEAGQCAWCHKQGQYGPDVIKQYRAVCIQNGLQGGKGDLMDSYKGDVTFSGYAKKTQTDTVLMEDLEATFIQMGETFPLLTSMSALPLLKCGQDFTMNNMSLSLCDVELQTD